MHKRMTHDEPGPDCWWYDPETIVVLANERPPVQALLQVEGPAGHDVGEGQGGGEEGEAEVARGRPTGG